MFLISILEAEDFGDELYPVMRENLIGIINQEPVGAIIAVGDTKGMIYRLLTELAIEYPYIFFTILLSSDKLAYETDSTDWPHILSLDCNIAYGDPRTAKQRRRKTIIEHSDIVICRKKYCNDIRKNNCRCDIIVV